MVHSLAKDTFDGGEGILGAFDSVLDFDGLEDLVDVCLEHHAAHDDLVEDKVDAVHVEDEIELADVLKALVERLDKHLNEIEDAELGFGGIDAKHKVERGVMSVDQFCVLLVVVVVVSLLRTNK